MESKNAVEQAQSENHLGDSPHGDGGNKTSKKKKMKRSKGTKEIQKLESGASKAERRLARAVLVGLNSWDKRRSKSASKRKDGALRDSVKNGARAVSKLVSEAAKAPSDLIDSLNPVFDKKSGKRAMKTIRGML
jgi:hypothetical protein